MIYPDKIFDKENIIRAAKHNMEQKENIIRAAKHNIEQRLKETLVER